MLAGAYSAAAVAVEKHTALLGSEARTVATLIVDAARPKTDAAHSARVCGTTQGEAVAVGLAAIVLLAADLALLAAVAARGSRRTRVLAATSALAHTALITYGRLRAARLRSAAATELAGGEVSDQEAVKQALRKRIAEAQAAAVKSGRRTA